MQSEDSALPEAVPEKPARRRATAADGALQRQQQALAEALALAQSIDYQAQPTIPPELLPRGKVGKGRKPQVVRGRYRISPEERDRLDELKAQARRLELKVRKNELVRAGLLLLGALNEAELKAVLLRIDGVTHAAAPRKSKR